MDTGFEPGILMNFVSGIRVIGIGKSADDDFADDGRNNGHTLGKPVAYLRRGFSSGGKIRRNDRSLQIGKIACAAGQSLGTSTRIFISGGSRDVLIGIAGLATPTRQRLVMTERPLVIVYCTLTWPVSR